MAFDKCMAQQVNPGIWHPTLYAGWVNDTERGGMSPAASLFWSQSGRMGLLRPGCDIEDALEDWDKSEHGAEPDYDAPELDVNVDCCDDNQRVMEDVIIELQPEMFATTTEVAGKRPGSNLEVDLKDLVNWFSATSRAALVAARQRLALGLVTASVTTAAARSVGKPPGQPAAPENVGECHHLRLQAGGCSFGPTLPSASARRALSPCAPTLHLDVDVARRIEGATARRLERPSGVHKVEVHSGVSFPKPRPSTWEYTTGYKNSSATGAVLHVFEPTTLGVLLREQLQAMVEWQVHRAPYRGSLPDLAIRD